jgi:hypothetical protein
MKGRSVPLGGARNGRKRGKQNRGELAASNLTAMTRHSIWLESDAGTHNREVRMTCLRSKAQSATLQSIRTTRKGTS